MALRGLEITWLYIAILFISCTIICLLEYKNSTFFLFRKHFSFCFSLTLHLSSIVISLPVIL